MKLIIHNYFITMVIEQALFKCICVPYLYEVSNIKFDYSSSNFYLQRLLLINKKVCIRKTYISINYSMHAIALEKCYL